MAASGSGSCAKYVVRGWNTEMRRRVGLRFVAARGPEADGKDGRGRMVSLEEARGRSHEKEDEEEQEDEEEEKKKEEDTEDGDEHEDGEEEMRRR